DPPGLVIGGEDLLVVVACTSPPARAPLAHSEPVTVAAALEKEAAEMERARISDLKPAAARVELGCQGEVADRGGGERHQSEVDGSCGVGLALALLLSSCNLPGLPTPSASATPANTSRVSHLQLSEAEDAQTLDPALIDDPTSLAIGAELFQGLTRLDATLRPVPALAQSWEITDSGRAYTFHLRAAKYQSGA